MKTLIITLLLFSILDANAQEFSMQPKGKLSELTLEIENLFTDLDIQGSTGNEVRITADNYKGAPEKAAGLRTLTAAGPDNTGIGMNINQAGNTVTVSSTRRNRNHAVYHFSVPANIKLRINSGGYKSEDILIRGMNNEVDVKSQVGDLNLEDITGPIIASTLSADINIKFSSLNQSSPTSISSVSGDIDITLPENSKGNFRLTTVSGDVYTDFNFDKVNKNSGKQSMWEGWGGTNASARLNGGGVEFAVKSVSGDIYIRKAKN